MGTPSASNSPSAFSSQVLSFNFGQKADQNSTVSVEKDDLLSYFPTSCPASANASREFKVEKEGGMADGARVCSRDELASGTISESVNWTPCEPG